MNDRQTEDWMAEEHLLKKKNYTSWMDAYCLISNDIQIVPHPKKKKKTSYQIIRLSASISVETVNWSEYALE